jgi:hypothetical protein
VIGFSLQHKTQSTNNYFVCYYAVCYDIVCYDIVCYDVVCNHIVCYDVVCYDIVCKWTANGLLSTVNGLLMV